MSVSQKIGAGNGDGFLDASGAAVWAGALLLMPFRLVASVGAGVVVGTLQEHLYLNRPFRIKGVYGLASAIAGATDPKFDVYVGATPATALSAQVTLDVADTVYAGTVASASTVHPAGIVSLRAVTGADTGAITNLEVYLEIELIPA